MRVTIVENPLTAKQWLVRSFGWTVGSLAGWVLLMNCLRYEQFGGTLWLALGFALVPHLLIWWKAVDSSWWRQDVEQSELWAFGLAKLWLMTLLVFQVACLFLLLSLLGLVLGGNEGANWGSPKT